MINRINLIFGLKDNKMVSGFKHKYIYVYIYIYIYILSYIYLDDIRTYNKVHAVQTAHT